MTAIENFSKLTRTFAYSYTFSRLNRTIQYHGRSTFNVRYSCIYRKYSVLKKQDTLNSHSIRFKIKGYTKSSLATSNGNLEIVADNYSSVGPFVNENDLRTLESNYLLENTSISKGT
jgi:hypothetical protein